jgi:16S rRNA (guanine527-N7)-methyltransferase
VKHSQPPIPSAAHATLQKLSSLTRKASQTQNLVSPDDLPELFTRHIQDSLAPLLRTEELRLEESGQWLDFGSGAGFPLLPLAIALPHWKFIGVEPRSLRARHLQHLSEELGLANVRILCAKAEAVQTFPDIRAKCQVVSCRAVGSIPDDGKRAHPFLTEGGHFVTYKHDEHIDEIDGYLPLSYVPYQLPGEAGLRHLVTAQILSIQADS